MVLGLFILPRHNHFDNHGLDRACGLLIYAFLKFLKKNGPHRLSKHQFGLCDRRLLAATGDLISFYFPGARLQHMATLLLSFQAISTVAVLRTKNGKTNVACAHELPSKAQEQHRSSVLT